MTRKLCITMLALVVAAALIGISYAERSSTGTGSMGATTGTTTSRSTGTPTTTQPGATTGNTGTVTDTTDRTTLPGTTTIPGTTTTPPGTTTTIPGTTTTIPGTMTTPPGTTTTPPGTTTGATPETTAQVQVVTGTVRSVNPATNTVVIRLDKDFGGKRRGELMAFNLAEQARLEDPRVRSLSDLKIRDHVELTITESTGRPMIHALRPLSGNTGGGAVTGGGATTGRQRTR